MNRIFPNPVLCADSIDYKDPSAYTYTAQRSSETIISVTHTLKKGNFVSETILAKQSSFFTTVVGDRTLYRTTYGHKNDKTYEHENDKNEIVATQTFEVPKFRNNTVIYLHSGVANHCKPITKKWDEKTQITYIGRTLCNHSFTFKPYALLASGGWQKDSPSLPLFQIESSKDVEPGEMETTLVTDVNLRIKIKMHPRLADMSKRKKHTRYQILTTAFAQALAEIKTTVQEAPQPDESDLLIAAQDLALWLDNQRYPSWEEDDFNPSLIATKFRPIPLE